MSNGVSYPQSDNKRVDFSDPLRGTSEDPTDRDSISPVSLPVYRGFLVEYSSCLSIDQYISQRSNNSSTSIPSGVLVWTPVISVTEVFCRL